MSAKSRQCTRAYVGKCERCGWCCIGRPCGWGVQYGRRTTGRCRFLQVDPADPLRFVCGLYLRLDREQSPQAFIMAVELHFGKGCTLPGNPRRLMLERMPRGAP